MYYQGKVGHTNRSIDCDFTRKLFFSKDRKIRGTNEIQDSKGKTGNVFAVKHSVRLTQPLNPGYQCCDYYCLFSTISIGRYFGAFQVFFLLGISEEDQFKLLEQHGVTQN